MKKIRTSRHIEKIDAQNRPVYSQAVQVSQFPHKDVTVWLRAYDKQYLLPESGLFQADIYFVENEYTNKEGRKIRDMKIRFENLQPITN